MRLRTLLATVALLFALPALAADAPEPASVRYEVRILKVPAGFGARAGLNLSRDTILTDAQLQALMETADREQHANTMMAPKITAFDGDTATLKVGEEQFFANSVEAVKVKGQTVCITKQMPVYLGYTLTAQGRVSADGGYVHARVGLTHTQVVGNVELTPIVTQITPVFEGASVGKPIPFTQYLQAPDIRKERAERAAIVPNGGTLVVGGWKETADANDEPGRKNKKPKPATEYEVVVLATVRVARPEAPAVRPAGWFTK